MSPAAVTHGLRYYMSQVGPGGKFVVELVAAHKAVAVFAVIALEEVGVPIPLPGDAVIAYAGHLVARSAIDPVSAFLAVVAGAMLGASVLYWLARRFGQPFIKRYGPYIHARAGRVERLEGWFQRWGALVVVIGRHVPGLRMVISVCAGLFGVSYPVFLGSVALSSSIWAVMFLAIGNRLDRSIGPYMTLTPLHLLPSTLVVTASLVYAIILRRRARRAEATALSQSPAVL
jgi:membrane protein DedA with SNARE-associated domain